MLRMTSLALAIIASLFAEALAAEETFDTNFMVRRDERGQRQSLSVYR